MYRLDEAVDMTHEGGHQDSGILEFEACSIQLCLVGGMSTFYCLFICS
jgi:hypothetical protein